jgi:hypothetical protein
MKSPCIDEEAVSLDAGCIAMSLQTEVLLIPSCSAIALLDMRPEKLMNCLNMADGGPQCASS